MKVPEIPQSFRIYAKNVQRYLPEQYVRIIPFADKRNIPSSVDVLWDIRWGAAPLRLIFS